MSERSDSTPPVACTLTPEQVADRTDELADLADRYRGAEALDDGYVLRFDGEAAAFQTVARFVTRERECCAFAEYALVTAPPYEETRLTITGPEGTKPMFGDGLVELLTAADG